MAPVTDWLSVGRSRRLACLLLVTHLLALAAVFFGVKAGWLLISCVLFVVVHGVYVFRRYVLLLGPGAIKAVSWRGGVWRLHTGDGRAVEGVPNSATVLTGRLTLLSFSVGGRRRHLRVPLLGDAVDFQALRRLRVQLRYGDNPKAL